MPPKKGKGKRKAAPKKIKPKPKKRNPARKRARVQKVIPKSETTMTLVKPESEQSEEHKQILNIPVNTLNRSRCLKQGHIGAILGDGSYGQVFEFCDQKSCKYVLKIQSLDTLNPGSTHLGAYLREVFFHKYVESHSKIPIAPKLYDDWICEDPELLGLNPASLALGCMLLDRWNGSLNKKDSFRNDEKIRFIEQAVKWMDELVPMRIYHNDIASRNILYRGEGGNIVFTLTDWGLARIEQDPEKLRDLYARDFREVVQIWGNE